MPDTKPAEFSVAWISRGRLFLKRGDAPVQEIESDFAKSSLQREMQHSQNQSWKGRSGVWGDLGMAPPGMAPWENQVESRRTIDFVTLAKGDTPNEIYYVLNLGAVGGLFKYDAESDEETRLVHSQDFRAQDISRHPDDGRIAISTRRDDGTTGLSITRHDGLYGKAITLSDAIDEAPSWLPDGTKRLVFQSSTIGRDEQGQAIGKTTCRIELMDLEKEEISSLFEEPEHDLLQPRFINDESVLCIKRPYKATHQKPPTLLEVAENVVLFPYRLARTVVHFFNFMSMAFTGKPLIMSGPQQQRPPAHKALMMLYGQAVDTQHAMANGAGKDKDKPLVPKEWELITRSCAGEQRVLAENVLAFDSNSDGDVVYTDGRRIYRLHKNGVPETIAEGEVIKKVAILS